MVCRGGPWKVPWYAVEGFAAGGATEIPRHAAKRNNIVHASAGAVGMRVWAVWGMRYADDTGIVSTSA